MRLNYETVLVGDKCVLVPYRKEHVMRYHEWMKSPAMLEATGSEPLSLKEEYEMQESWRDDHEKCTFIVLSRDRVCEIPSMMLPNYATADDSKFSDYEDDGFVHKTLSAMAGDVNLFLSEEQGEYDDEAPISEPSTEETGVKKYVQAELDIMVAEQDCLRKGIGKEACCMMMLYAARNLSIRRFFCKINEDNESSLSLFRKLGFEECAYAACFKQFEYELKRESPKEMVSVLTGLLGRSALLFIRCPVGPEEEEATGG